MALAAQKTWQFHRTIEGFVENDLPDYNHTRRFWYWLKELWVAAGWTVESSNNGNGSFGNNDQVDHFPGELDAFRTSSNDIYVVLKAPAGSGLTTEVCFYSGYSSGQSNARAMGIIISPIAGFGTVNGGGNGANGSRPSASDEHVFTTGTSSSDYTILNATAQMYLTRSTDGKNHRFFVKQAHCVDIFVAIETLENAHPDLGDDLIFIARNNDLSAETTANQSGYMKNDYFASDLYRGRISGVNEPIFLGGQGFNNAGVQSSLRVMADRRAVVSPVEAYCDTGGKRAFYGTVPDLYYGPVRQFDTGLGDSVDGPINWYQNGTLIIPWDPTEPLPINF